jgi:crotonobetainyl-CoA:carnitine CoA-transferase CaiB-like acyl-CoA transferase
MTSEEDMVSGQGALDGIRVLDVTQVMAGPYCAMQLSDMGADVIKVEPPDGDSTRRMAGATADDSPAFNAVNRGKRSIVLDLKDEVARRAFARLADTADILIENGRPGAMARLGLDYASLSPRCPRLIYASISGYGQTGPDALKGGFDLIAQGVSGLMSVTGEAGGPPTKVGVPVTDLGAGLFALAAILAALHHRDRTGHGQYVETSLVEAGLALSVWEAAQYFADGSEPRAMGSAHRMLAPYQAIRCADGYITIGAGTDRLFQRLADRLGHAEWPSQTAYANETARVANRAALARDIEAVTVHEPRAHWLEALEREGIPCGPINAYSEAFADRQVLARDMVVEVDHATRGRVRTLGSPIKMSVTPVAIGRRAPRLGEHTREVLLEAGMTVEEIEGVGGEGVRS